MAKERRVRPRAKVARSPFRRDVNSRISALPRCSTIRPCLPTRTSFKSVSQRARLETASETSRAAARLATEAFSERARRDGRFEDAGKHSGRVTRAPKCSSTSLASATEFTSRARLTASTSRGGAGLSLRCNASDRRGTPCHRRRPWTMSRELVSQGQLLAPTDPAEFAAEVAGDLRGRRGPLSCRRRMANELAGLIRPVARKSADSTLSTRPPRRQSAPARSAVLRERGCVALRPCRRSWNHGAQRADPRFGS